VALTATATVKTYMGITDTSSDTLIGTIVSSVDASIKRYLGRQIESASIASETVDGNGIDDFVVLSDWPVTAVATVVLAGTTLSSSYYAFDATGRLYYKPGGSDAYGAWPLGRRNLVVTYTAGYSSVPADLAMAATKQAAQEAKLSAVQGGRLGDRSTILQDGGTAQYVVATWATGVQDVLDTYRAARCL